MVTGVQFAPLNSERKQRRGEGGGGFGGRELGVLLVPPPKRLASGKTTPQSPSLEHKWLSPLHFYPHETRKNH